MNFENISCKNNFQNYLNNLGDKMVIIWFSASWCVPCKRIKSTCEERFKEIENKNIDVYIVDVDEHMELFGWLKTRKMLSGIPSILAYFGHEERDVWYIPDDSVSGGEKNAGNDFFDRSIKRHSQDKNFNK